ncbi:MAG: DUF4365 domain-containing protein [Solirubrobacteraceae bacterium]
MPKRPTQHVIADRAAAAVRTVIADAGFAVETVQSDYGEDLLVQTSLNGEMDASRIWVQVKGTAQIARHCSADGSWTYSVPVEHSRRWRRTADTVLIVLWDVKHGQGRYAISRDLHDGARSAVARFDPSQCFDTAAMVRIGWLARIGRYCDLLMTEKASGEFEQELKDGPPTEARKRMVGLAVDLLCDLGALNKGADDRIRCDRDFRLTIIRRFEELAAGEQAAGREEVESSLSSAMTHAVMRRCESVTGEARMPLVIVDPTVTALMVVFGFHGTEWDEIMAA